MKAFDLEKALAGEPVVTRDGRAVTQLHCFDVANDYLYPLYGVINGAIVQFRIHGKSEVAENPYDLFMAEPERWVNVYFNNQIGNACCGIIYPSEAKAKDNISSSQYYQTTIKLK